ncbi:hypothetical protein DFR50_1463 [Roseiarcus fermentans]|uniref:Uncharacterized protein n=1 Tax=Roseiarcus fermentans TaxID=1473586 RepID=A0A366ENL0_9HYPH|nr:hypothetical protein [Roseiarcus fermentans]RBP03079.1 hypothetical protein DFR50_1463 [Roseiarcus fermentans]
MPLIAVLASTSPFSARAHLQALGRSAAVAVVGVSVWIALVCSASSHAGADGRDPVNAPAWTLGASTSFDAGPAFRSGAMSSCAATYE